MLQGVCAENGEKEGRGNRYPLVIGSGLHSNLTNTLMATGDSLICFM